MGLAGVQQVQWFTRGGYVAVSPPIVELDVEPALRRSGYVTCISGKRPLNHGATKVPLMRYSADAPVAVGLGPSPASPFVPQRRGDPIGNRAIQMGVN